MQGKLLIKLLLPLVLWSAWTIALAGSAMETDYVWVARFQETMNKAYGGQVEAQYELARMYEQGKGTRRDLGQALNWYRKSAGQGHEKAQARLGYMYLHGEGVDRNPQLAIKLLTDAAEAENVRAQHHLAEAYEQGAGVRRDSKKAIKWYKRSARGGYKPAVAALAKLERRLASEEKRRRKAKLAAKKKAQAAREKARKAAAAKAARSQAKSTRRNLTELLYNSTWSTDDDEALLLPSGINECSQTEDMSIECLSKEMQRDIGNSTVIYITRALIHNVDRNGHFKITYQNKVLYVKRHKSNNILFDDDSADISKGWQAKYQMKCRLGDERSQVDCSQENAPDSVFFRQVEPAPG